MYRIECRVEQPVPVWGNFPWDVVFAQRSDRWGRGC